MAGEQKQVVISPLSALTNLQQLVVKGLVPQAEQQQQEQMCLPASLTSLMIEGEQQLDKEAARVATTNWLQHAAGCSNLQQLQLINLYGEDWGLQHLDFGGIAHLKELRFVNSPGRDTSVGRILPASITKLTNLEVLWLGTLGSSHPWEYYYWDLDDENVLSLMDVSEQCPMLRQLGPLCKCDNSDVPRPFKHLSHLVLLDSVPLWLDHIRCPSLVNLTIEPASKSISDELLQQLCQLKGLTCLQLNTQSINQSKRKTSNANGQTNLGHKHKAPDHNHEATQPMVDLPHTS